MRDYEDKLKRWTPPSNAAPPPEPVVDFAQSIALYRRLITEFPNYRLNDGDLLPARLLPGEAERLREAPSRRTTTLIDNYPKSKFATEAWVRIGEYYFDDYDDPDALAQAARGLRARDQGHQAPALRQVPLQAGLDLLPHGPLRATRCSASSSWWTTTRHRRRRRATRTSAATCAARRSSTPRSASPTRSGARSPRRRRPSRSWAAAPTRPRSTAAWATSTSTRPSTPTPSPPTGWCCSRTRSPSTPPRSSRRSSRPTSVTAKLDEAFAESETLANAYAPGHARGTRSTRRDPDVIAAAQDLAEQQPLLAAPCTTTSRRWP